MAYSALADSGRDYGGANGFRPPEGYFNNGNGEVRRKTGAVEHAPNVDSPTQVYIPLIRLGVKEETCDTLDCVELLFRSLLVTVP